MQIEHLIVQNHYRSTMNTINHKNNHLTDDSSDEEESYISSTSSLENERLLPLIDTRSIASSTPSISNFRGLDSSAQFRSKAYDPIFSDYEPSFLHLSNSSTSVCTPCDVHCHEKSRPHSKVTLRRKKAGLFINSNVQIEPVNNDTHLDLLKENYGASLDGRIDDSPLGDVSATVVHKLKDYSQSIIYEQLSEKTFNNSPSLISHKKPSPDYQTANASCSFITQQDSNVFGDQFFRLTPTKRNNPSDDEVSKERITPVLNGDLTNTGMNECIPEFFRYFKTPGTGTRRGFHWKGFSFCGDTSNQNKFLSPVNNSPVMLKCFSDSCESDTLESERQSIKDEIPETQNDHKGYTRINSTHIRFSNHKLGRNISSMFDTQNTNDSPYRLNEPNNVNKTLSPHLLKDSMGLSQPFFSINSQIFVSYLNHNTFPEYVHAFERVVYPSAGVKGLYSQIQLTSCFTNLSNSQISEKTENIFVPMAILLDYNSLKTDEQVHQAKETVCHIWAIFSEYLPILTVFSSSSEYKMLSDASNLGDINMLFDTQFFKDEPDYAQDIISIGIKLIEEFTYRERYVSSTGKDYCSRQIFIITSSLDSISRTILDLPGTRYHIVSINGNATVLDKILENSPSEYMERDTKTGWTFTGLPSLDILSNLKQCIQTDTHFRPLENVMVTLHYPNQNINPIVISRILRLYPGSNIKLLVRFLLPDTQIGGIRIVQVDEKGGDIYSKTPLQAFNVENFGLGYIHNLSNKDLGNITQNFIDSHVCGKIISSNHSISTVANTIVYCYIKISYRLPYIQGRVEKVFQVLQGDENDLFNFSVNINDAPEAEAERLKLKNTEEFKRLISGLSANPIDISLLDNVEEYEEEFVNEFDEMERDDEYGDYPMACDEYPQEENDITNGLK